MSDDERYGVVDIYYRVYIPQSPKAWQRILNGYNAWQAKELGIPLSELDDLKVRLNQFLDEPLEDGTRELDPTEFALWMMDAYSEMENAGSAWDAYELFPRLGLESAEYYD